MNPDHLVYGAQATSGSPRNPLEGVAQELREAEATYHSASRTVAELEKAAAHFANVSGQAYARMKAAEKDLLERARR